MKRVSVLGSTGSVGTQTMDVLAHAGVEQVSVQALVAGSNAKMLIAQAKQFKPACVAIADKTKYQMVKDAVSSDITVLAGEEGIVEAASLPTDWCMAAITGMAGLNATMAAITATRHLAFANKEILVAAGPQMLDAAHKNNTILLPVDSEHNAIFQVFADHQRDKIKRIVLTASGGPLRTLPVADFANVTVAQALAHPNWTMGRKISIDSASMMNKALEVIEAAYLFDLPSDKIDVLVHPQSTVHGMVEYADGSILAQLGPKDMRTSITHTFAWPQRGVSVGNRLDLQTMTQLTFEPLDNVKFPAVELARAALKSGQAACIAFNAANEIAVAAFLDGQIGFNDIIRLVRAGLQVNPPTTLQTLADVVQFDHHVRMTISASIRKQAV